MGEWVLKLLRKKFVQNLLRPQRIAVRFILCVFVCRGGGVSLLNVKSRKGLYSKRDAT